MILPPNAATISTHATRTAQQPCNKKQHYYQPAASYNKHNNSARALIINTNKYYGYSYYNNINCYRQTEQRLI